ncbi:DUF7133 domain-containing protein [Parafilimonas terrae]|uniref:Putative membrane-bound dehydrogenase domain-containing protein n=1 Tax=Parafilimonas terrae TaxID=1465490 RepID=A0A1I5XQK1_9BACT|nr:HEAT repeat domain-containing protein [Parafilimonas terrae]SFQ34223.1 putative membrane-bound dehydrogenase domain-containing protein [Parafilimonas terrae]
MKHALLALFAVAIIALLPCCKSGDQNEKPVFNPHPTAAYLSPEESMKKMYLPEGYSIELVASEPMIQEPVAITWDANGRMYVAEMLTYMRDADASDEQLPLSRIMLLEDTDNDGKMDKSSVFIDSLLLPRMMQSVGNELLVNETNTITITSYKDTDGDGKADVKRVVYKNDAYTASDANMEHQRSGLDWNIDNWMYMTYEGLRFRYVNGMIEADTIHSGGSGQWGVTHDNYGRLFYSSAGGETPVLGFQINPVYGKLGFPDEFTPEFQQVWSIMATPDVEGGVKRLRPNNTLNHFTACCGQSIYRGDALPKDFVGDYLVCEPVGRIIRRAKVETKEGKTTLKNAYDSAEFIASQDMNFRPVNTATGPDGNLYIVDMYRGIIQQGNWTKPGTFLRNKIDSLGLAANIDHGRIYRVVYNGGKRDPQPKMLDEPVDKLVQYLGHANGWWRDNAQKLIVISGDKTVVPELKNIVAGKATDAGNKGNALARLHALWTLDGLHAVDNNVLLQAFADADPQVRRAAVWISESWLKKNDAAMIEEVTKLQKDPSYDVRVQVLLSMSQSGATAAQAVVKTIVDNNAGNEMIKATKDALEKAAIVKALAARVSGLPQNDRRAVLNGAVIFRSLCSNCHGNEGKGIAGVTSVMTAPALQGSKFLKLSQKDNAIRILLNGLSGPVDGKTYASEMPSMAANNNGWIASVLSYVRFEFGDHGGKNNDLIGVRSDEVKKMREENEGRDKPWTEGELMKK